MLVRPDMRAHGYGKQLLLKGITEAQGHFSLTDESIVVLSATAEKDTLRFYLRCGFRNLSEDEEGALGYDRHLEMQATIKTIRERLRPEGVPLVVAEARAGFLDEEGSETLMPLNIATPVPIAELMVRFNNKLIVRLPVYVPKISLLGY